MKSFFKTYFIVFSILIGIAGFVALLFWGASQLFGINGPIIAGIVLAIVVLSFGLTVSIESDH
jgi:hypothetical protein